jgi:hypothetical protein
VIGGQLRVARQQAIRLEQPRQIRVVRHVEQHGEDPRQRQYDVQLRESQYAEPRGYWDRREEDRPAEIGVHEHRETSDPVGPRAGEQAEQQPGSRLAGPQQRHLEGGRVQGEYGEQWDRDHAQARAELTEQVCGPEAAEIGVSQDARGGHAADGKR